MSIFCSIMRFIGVFGLVVGIAGCDLSTPTHVGDNSKIPSNLHPVSFSSLPDWEKDNVLYALQAFRNTCSAKMQQSGQVVYDPELMREKCNRLPSASANVATVRAWFESNFQPYQVYNENGEKTGLYTGYYSPVINACRKKTEQCNEPIMAVPVNGDNYKGVEKRAIVENKIGRVLYWANIVDVQNLQIQGSGLLKLEDGKMVKLNFAAVNDMPFKSIGAQLKARNIKPEGGYSADAVWTHLKKNPALAKEVIYNNPRYVYFYETKQQSVIGKLGTPLSKIRSIAMDDSLYALGMPVYISTRLSDGSPFNRLMIAQDTGSAIKGWIRADIFFGSGDAAYQVAQGQHSKGQMFILMPKEYVYVEPR